MKYTKNLLALVALALVSTTAPAMAASADDYLNHMVAAQEAAKKGDVEGSIKWYQTALQDKSNQPKSYEAMMARYMLGRKYIEVRKYKEAEDQLTQALAGYTACKGSKSDDVAWSAGYLANVSMLLGKTKEAIAAFDTAIAAAEGKPAIQTQMAHWYCMRGTCLGALKLPGADESFKRSLAIGEKLPPDDMIAADIQDYAAYLGRKGDKAGADKYNAKADAMLAKLPK